MLQKTDSIEGAEKEETDCELKKKERLGITFWLGTIQIVTNILISLKNLRKWSQSRHKEKQRQKMIFFNCLSLTGAKVESFFF